jgi:hypothetical protein
VQVSEKWVNATGTKKNRNICFMLIISAVINQSVSQNCDMVINQSHNNCIQQKLFVRVEQFLCSHRFSSFLMRLEFVEVFAKKSGM